jgi:lipoprotein-anchoring transpeptidase ErfK/SrfK
VGAVSRRKFGVLVASGLAAVLLDACNKSGKSASPASSAGSPGQLPTSSAVASTTAPPPVSPAVLALDPTNGAAAVSPAHPVTVTAGGGTIDGVTLLSSSGASVPGVLSADKTTWTASQPLGYQRSYTLTAKAVNSAGVPATSTAAFNTLKPDNMTQPALNTRGGGTLTNGATYGVGMVVRVHFDEQIKDKAAAERALIVTTTPAVEGSWFWLDSQNVLWRPQNYYTPGTVVSVTAKVYGVEVGPGLYGQSDVSASFTIGQKQVSIADDTTHQVSVYFNDVLQRTMPTSMGKGGYATGSSGQQISFFTPSGIYTVLDKSNPVLMSSASYGLPINGPGGYSELINWATRISTDGIYLHQLNSTVWAQGSRDLSHGCLNLNYDNATWFYNTSQVGDPVEVQHTGGAPLALWQNGDWSLPWAQWTAGSALNG